MASVQRLPDWLGRCRENTSRDEEAELLTKIRHTSSTRFLATLVKDTSCGVVFRCAALSRYISLKGDYARPLIEYLTDPDSEADYQLRREAYLWVASLDADSPKHSRIDSEAVAARGGVLAEEAGTNWRTRAASDPDPRVRLIAQLGN